MPDEQHNEEGAEAEKAIEINLGGGDSVPPSDPKAQRLKYWANVIATSAALLTAVAAVLKPQDQTVTKNTYEQLKTSIEQTNENVKQNHDDMVALHNYLEGYFASNSNVSLPPLVQTSAPPPVPIPTVAPTAKKPPPAPSASFAMPTMTAYAPAPQTQFPLPPVTSPASAAPLPPFDSVAAKK